MTTERQEPTDGAPTPGRGVTQVGQVFERLERATRRLPGTAPRRARPTRAAPAREQLASLIDALGDSSHPLHASAVDELVAIGPAAVPALCEAIDPRHSWLTIYRAAEAAGRIGDGRAAGPLVQALQHPNGNVRWSAVRALTQLGDVRSLIELRRVARTDQGRTSWGEPVAGAAQSALAEISRRSVWGQSLELVKTAVTCVLMILALILAFSVVSRFRAELDSFGLVIPGQTQIPEFVLPTPLPEEESAPTAEESPAESSLAPTADTADAPLIDPVLAPTTAAIGASGVITGTVRQDANVRPAPNTGNEPIGRVGSGDEIVFLARTSNGQWYLIRLADAGSSAIRSPDGTGWINQSLVSAPVGELPVQDPAAPQAAPTPTANP